MSLNDNRAALRGPRRQLVFELIETARHMRGFMEAVAQRHGTTRAQWGLLGRLRRNEGVSQAELAADMEIAPITLARLIDRTEAQGYIERQPHGTDRRINRLFLTERGRDVVDGLDRQREEIASTVLEGVDDQAVATTIDVLGRIAHQLRRQNTSAALPAPTHSTPRLAGKRAAARRKSLTGAVS
jgi:MarR family transcriptional regulator, transcriptional regulator for hemolysin